MTNENRLKSLYDARIALYGVLVEAEVTAKYTGDEELAEEISRLQSELKAEIETMDSGDND